LPRKAGGGRDRAGAADRARLRPCREKRARGSARRSSRSAPWSEWSAWRKPRSRCSAPT